MSTVTTAVASNASRFFNAAKTVGTMMASGALIGAGVGAGILTTGAVVLVGGAVVGGTLIAVEAVNKKIEARKALKAAEQQKLS